MLNIFYTLILFPIGRVGCFLLQSSCTGFTRPQAIRHPSAAFCSIELKDTGSSPPALSFKILKFTCYKTYLY